MSDKIKEEFSTIKGLNNEVAHNMTISILSIERQSQKTEKY